MANKRRRYSREFKAEAVQLVLTAGVMVTKAAADHGILKSVLSKWVSLASEAAMPGAASDDVSSPES
jgi:transposase-like protein